MEADQSSRRPEVERTRPPRNQETYLNPYVAAKAGYIDEVIEPAETRQS
jgi:acetyl-CoA carboxylase carboxyltransferase component